jgi:phosphomannomutase
MGEKLLLFDVDGTITIAGQSITSQMSRMFCRLQSKGYILGIVGGGSYTKICQQLGPCVNLFPHIFSECGCVYHLGGNLIHTKNIRTHDLYPKINILIKVALAFLSKVDYVLSGNFIDLRTGIIYISLIGMQATEIERAIFMDLDKKNSYRKQLLNILLQTATDIGIESQLDILEGGSVGISVYPSEWNKTQVMNIICTNHTYDEIHYFGDKYHLGGNDYALINHPIVIGHGVDDVQSTLDLLEKIDY